MEVHACLDNCERSLFIALEEEPALNAETNPRVETPLESQILDEYNSVKLEPVNNDLAIARSTNFVFRKHTAPGEEKIIWVEPIEDSLNNTVII